MLKLTCKKNKKAQDTLACYACACKHSVNRVLCQRENITFKEEPMNYKDKTFKTAKELADKVPMSGLQVLAKQYHLKISPSEAKLKAAKKIFAAAEPLSAKREPGTRANSKKALLLAALATGPKTLDEMAKASGFDLKNLRVMISFLGNPKRTKEPISIVRDAEGRYAIGKAAK